MWLGKYVVSTRLCHVPHNTCEYWLYWHRNFTGDANWPTSSRDSTPCNFFFVWLHEHADKALTLAHLETNSRQVMAEISPDMGEKVVENYFKNELKLAKIREVFIWLIYWIIIIKEDFIKKYLFILKVFLSFTFGTTIWITFYMEKCTVWQWN